MGLQGRSMRDISNRTMKCCCITGILNETEGITPLPLCTQAEDTGLAFKDPKGIDFK